MADQAISPIRYSSDDSDQEDNPEYVSDDEMSVGAQSIQLQDAMADDKTEDGQADYYFEGEALKSSICNESWKMRRSVATTTTMRKLLNFIPPTI